jgi:hypothetical protein
MSQGSEPRHRRRHLPPKTWKGVTRRHHIRGSVQIRYKNWVRDLYETKGPGTPFTLHEMMTDCGADYDDRNDYSRAAELLMGWRKEFAEVMKLFFSGTDYDRYKAEGLSDEQLFRKMVETAISFSVYPVCADAADSYKYKLFDMASFVYLHEVRARCIVKEVERKAEYMALAFDKLPEMAGMYSRPALKGDGVVLKLPPGIECPVCSIHITGPVQFVDHYNAEHGPHAGGAAASAPPPDPPHAPLTCPLCKDVLLLRERGMYHCPTCKQQYDVNGKLAKSDDIAHKF